MQDAPGGALAAPQVGLPLRLAVIEDREELLKGSPPQEARDTRSGGPVQFHVIINPVITFLRNDTVDFYEGCLSLAGFSACLVVSVLARPNEFFFPFRFNCHASPSFFLPPKGFSS